MNYLYNDIMWNGFPVKNNHNKKCIDEYESLLCVNPNFVSTNRTDINEIKKIENKSYFQLDKLSVLDGILKEKIKILKTIQKHLLFKKVIYVEKKK